MSVSHVELVPQRNSLDYLGLFSRPAFPLWGEGGAIIGGLYDAFSPLGVGLRDIYTTGNENPVADQGVVANLGARSSFTFRFDRVEATLRNYIHDDLEALPEYLSRGENWIRASVPDHTFASRVITDAHHSSVTGASADEVLRSLGVRELNIKASPRGHGVSFHYDVVERNTRMDLVVDHSLAVAGGLFIQFGLVITGDVVDYRETLNWGRATVASLLSDIGLSVTRPAADD